jgi:hypothetical protein
MNDTETTATTERQLTGHFLTMDVHVSEPWQALPAFQMLRETAQLSGFPDIEDIRISVQVQFYGHTPEADFEALKNRIEDNWLGIDFKTTPRYRHEPLETVPSDAQ